MAEVTARRRGSKWEYRFELTPVGGKRKQFSRSGFETKKEALAAGANAYSNYIRKGEIFTPSSLSLADYMKIWQASYLEVNVKKQTQKSYGCMIRNHIVPDLGNYTLATLKAGVLQQWFDGLKKEGTLSYSTICLIKAILREALNYAVNPMEYIEFNPMVNVRLTAPKTKPERRSIITREDFGRLIDYMAMHCPDYVLACQIAWHTGMRQNEVLSLTWDDVDLSRDVIHLWRQFQDGEQTSLKSEAGRRDVYFGPTLHNILVEAGEKQSQDKETYDEWYQGYRLEGIRLVECTGPRGELDFVCRRPNGTRLKGKSIQAIVCKVRKATGIDFVFHSFRHSHATMLVERGVDIKAIQTRLGHSNIAVTLDIYTHETEGMARNAAMEFEASLAHGLEKRGQIVGNQGLQSECGVDDEKQQVLAIKRNVQEST